MNRSSEGRPRLPFHDQIGCFDCGKSSKSVCVYENSAYLMQGEEVKKVCKDCDDLMFDFAYLSYLFLCFPR